MTDTALLTVDEMYRADRLTISGGVAGLTLMEAAGTAIARAIRRRWRPRPVVVLCGPGNNGGDGLVVARLLRREGWPVRVHLLGDPGKLKGDAAVNAERWPGAIESLNVVDLSARPLIVDALFGAGLTRPPEGPARTLIEAINEASLDCVGVDVPSGVQGDSGAVLGVAPACATTVTFFRPKPGHLLYPGRGLCGDLVVADIGIPASVLEDIGPATHANAPALWRAAMPWPDAAGNKYTRGHAVVWGGEMTGAARLAAEAARRQGAGLVSIACEAAARPIYAAGAPGTIVHAVADIDALRSYLDDARRNAFLIGPGAGITGATRRRVLTAAEAGKALVLDADALTVFAEPPELLFSAIRAPCIMTPHEGEFRRLFETEEADKLARTRKAARRAGTVVVLKGADTVIAAPDGRAAINATAPPTLASAGTGDVLSGMCLGLLAQGMPAFEAACAAVWLHGTIAAGIGPGLIAEDLIDGLPAGLAALRQHPDMSC